MGLNHSHTEGTTSPVTCNRFDAKLDHHVLAGSVGLSLAPVAEDSLASSLAKKREKIFTSFAQPLFDEGLEWVCMSLNEGSLQCFLVS